jgi:hypothetical protein
MINNSQIIGNNYIIHTNNHLNNQLIQLPHNFLTNIQSYFRKISNVSSTALIYDSKITK